MSEKKENDDLIQEARRTRKMTGTGPDGPVRMKKEVGPMAATMIILGAIIGSGIYVSPTGNYIISLPPTYGFPYGIHFYHGHPTYILRNTISIISYKQSAKKP